MTIAKKFEYVSTLTASQIIGKSHTCFARWHAAGILAMSKDPKGNNIYSLPDVLHLSEIMHEKTMMETVALTGTPKMTLNRWCKQAPTKNHLLPRYIVCGRKYYYQKDIEAYLNHNLMPQPITVYSLPGGDGQ